MTTAEEFNKMVKLYQYVMIEPLAKAKLDCDKFDRLEFIYDIDSVNNKVIFGLIRKRPDKYAIDKMYCKLSEVEIFTIEYWYNNFSKLLEESERWKWEH